MKQRSNYYAQYMSEDYDKLKRLLDEGNVVVCFVNYEYRTGDMKIIFRDVAKVKSNDYNQNSMNYGYVVEARGIRYMEWDRRMPDLRHVTFEDMCKELKLQFIDVCSI